MHLMTPRRASALALGFSVAGVVLVLLLMVLAARSGPSGVVHGTAHDPVFHAPRPSSTDTSSAGSTPAPPVRLPQGQSSVPGAPVIGTIIRYALFAWLLVLVFRVVRWAWQDLQARRRPEPRVPDIDFDVLADPVPLIDEMRRDSREHFELLLGGSPRNAIVACWDRFEEQAERAGIARRPWETPSEFTIRLLDAASADSAAVTRLSALYGEARFSTHPITEDQRHQAFEALQRIHESIGMPAGATW